ncbi:MAG: sugar ABC transporter ATP-binding protein [Chloroflexi bacterium 54-19]|nr:MAG: sugar ABC transporter ATP-binding protein [Chloroflexi bacterium 54-19]
MNYQQRRFISKLALTFILGFLAIIMILPFVWMISTSFKTGNEVFNYPIEWLPAHPVFDNHIKVWTEGFLTYYLNSLKISFLCMIGSCFWGALAAYGFSRIEFKGRDQLFFLYLAMLMIPPQILFVPRFIMFNWAGIYNTHWALILPGQFTIFGVFLLRQFFKGIPREISESAAIDGAGHLRIFSQIILPLAKPALVTFCILDFSWNWNNYEDALVFLVDRNLYTVPLGLTNFIGEHNVDYNGMMAAAVAAIIPMLIVFLVGQKFIIQGVANTGVKG